MCDRQTTFHPPFDLVVDHCHDTGEVRGLICNACNAILGHIEATNIRLEKWLERVEGYLKR